ncbi:MAG: hypothetical protein ACRELY_11810 [Polyangiaceae bacterium]
MCPPPVRVDAVGADAGPTLIALALLVALLVAMTGCHKTLGNSAVDASVPSPSASVALAISPSSSAPSLVSDSGSTPLRYSIERRVFKQKSKSEDDASPGDCVVAIEYPEVVGLSDAKVAKRIDDRLRPEKWDGDCEGPSTVDGKFFVGFRGESVLAIRTTVFANVFGAAHPSGGREEFNIAIATGNLIPLDAVLTRAGMSKYKSLLLPLVTAEMKSIEPSTFQNEIDIVMDGFTGSYLLDNDGIRFFPDLPQAFAAVGADGFFLAYAKLAPYLQAKSEAREAWAAQAPR